MTRSQLLVISNGKSGLYRTLLSIWKLTCFPTVVTILTSPDKVSVIEKSINTVKEDTSLGGPPYEILNCESGWEKEISQILRKIQLDLIGFIAERDMFLPSYSDLICGKVSQSESYLATYRQRRKFGNSKIHNPVTFSERIPISSLVLHRKDVINFVQAAVFHQNFECTITSELYNNRNISEQGLVRVLIQSNTKSPYDL